jgi:menaquinone-dependent protoporphyrinogen oxidase
MRVLVTWGSRRGGTEEIARAVGEELRSDGLQVEVLSPGEARRAADFDAAIVGGALYANRWHRDARRFVLSQEKRLRRVPVWFFSSGPLDDSAGRQNIAPPRQVRSLMERVGALGHVTFGGRLAPDARGFPASAMAKKLAGDWRDFARVRAWASEIAEALPAARPGVAHELPGGSVPRLVAHGLVGWAACAALMGALLALASQGVALAVHAVAAPLIFSAVARAYFRLDGARPPLSAALEMTAVVMAMDALLALVLQDGAMFLSVAGTWLPFALIFLVVWMTGEIALMMPFPKPGPAK